LVEDLPLWINATAKGYSLVLVPAILCRYRISSASIQSSQFFNASAKLFYYKYKHKNILVKWLAPYVEQLKAKNGNKRNEVIFQILEVTSFPSFTNFKQLMRSVVLYPFSNYQRD
jgi:hypothetical protein